MNVLIILIFSTLHGANIREISEIAKGFLFFNTLGRISCHADCADDADFSTPLSPLAKRGSLSHSQALALSIRARDVAGNAIALPEFWSASGACARKGLAESAYAIKLRLFVA